MPGDAGPPTEKRVGATPDRWRSCNAHHLGCDEDRSGRRRGHRLRDRRPERSGRPSPRRAAEKRHGAHHRPRLRGEGEDGSTAIIEIEDSDVYEAFGDIAEDEHFDLLNDGEILEIAGALEAGQGALVIVWENTWAAKPTAIRDSGGVVVALERVPLVDVLRAIAALEEEEA